MQPKTLAFERGMPKKEALDPSLSYAHLEEMVPKMYHMSPTKLGRWLGWMQAAVVASGVADLEDMKEINKRYAD